MLLLLLACADPADSGALDVDRDGVAAPADCDDADPTVSPDLPEAPYDGLDNDCDAATVDDDLDGDGYGVAEDCDDADPARSPAAPEVTYDGVDNDCTILTPDDDLDGDGYPLAYDCDDADPTAAVATAEVPYDGLDNDCDDATPDDDLDGDGAPLAADCADTDPSVTAPARWEGDVAEGDLAAVCATPNGCGTVIGGSVTLGSETLVSLDGLACVTTIEGDLTVNGASALLSLHGLDRLTTVSGHLSLGAWEETKDGPVYTGNALLPSLAGLEALRIIGGALTIAGETSLTDVTAAWGIESVGGDVVIRGNPALAAADAAALVAAIETLGGSADLADNGP